MLLIHLGDFHGFLAFFETIGNYVKSGGFEKRSVSGKPL